MGFFVVALASILMFYIYSVSGGPFLLLNQHALEEKNFLKLTSLSFSRMH